MRATRATGAERVARGGKRKQRRKPADACAAPFDTGSQDYETSMPPARPRPHGIHAPRDARRAQLRRIRDGTTAPALNGNDDSTTGNKRR
ncbi:hypothetical protein BSIN_1257 [Burkholderia singularis]|uniref:Uncharacterized protein n=1 Tax=Burkholderia singularis TaxID=1503053 RepID=A0A238HD65_9BURK|nr:hypothetical protein BSIN_1257 [Burkholderia singularis]